ncbi:MAG: hypothetical protein KGJ86_18500, partial [Chloroflexota bacterium]|nr:hypothetical protein [Chloroflexota bacterium]
MAELEQSTSAAEAERERNRADYQSHLAHEAVVKALETGREELEAIFKRKADEEEALAQAEKDAARLATAILDLEALSDGAAERDLAVVEAQRAETDRAVEALSSDVERLEQSAAELRGRQETLAQLDRGDALLAFGRSTMAETAQAVAGRVRAAAAQCATVIINQLLDERSELSWSPDGSLLLARGDRASTLAQLNPTERTCAILAFRLALVRSVSKLQTVFIQGPSVADRRAHLDERLLGVSDFRQIIFSFDW